MDFATDKRTIGCILEDKAETNSGKIFFHFEDENFTYSETNKLANKVANGYSSLGVKKGDKVIVMLPNCAEFIFNWFGLAKLGAVGCPINIAYKGDLLRHVILISDAKAVVIHEDFLERIIPLQDDLSCIEKVIIFNPSGKKPDVEIKLLIVTFDDLIN